MKRMKLFAPIMACVTIATPMMVSLSSCGRVDYSEVISEIKDKAIETFMDLTRTTHRSPWAEGECYNYIKNKMANLEIDVAGQDQWSKVGEVADKINAEKAKWIAAGVKTDSVFQSYGNIWYDLPASKGMEDAPKIILHAHMDVSMAFNEDEDKLAWAKATKKIIDVTYDRDRELIYTNGKVSLGADAGLGIAAMLSMAELHTKFKHGGIRLLFTAGESEGTKQYASGADFLLNDQNYGGKQWDVRWPESGDPTVKGDSLFEGKKPFGETKGEFPFIISTSGIYKNFIYSSCGGIHQCQYNDQALTLNVPISKIGISGITKDDVNEVKWDENPVADNLELYTLKVDGLHGGQSAKYINSGYANALQMAMRMVFSADYKWRLFKANSQPGAYAIPSKSEIVFASSIKEETLRAKCELIVKTFKNAYPNENWDKFSWSLTQHTREEREKEGYKWALSHNQTIAITRLFAWDLIYGPTDWFDKEHKSVRTSCNFANLNMSVDQTGAAEKSFFSAYNVCRSADGNSLELFYNYSHTLIVDAFAHLYKVDKIGTVLDQLQAKEAAEKKTEHNDKPVWEKKDDNKMVQALLDGYKNMSIKPSTWDNHGWLEISTFIEAYSGAGFDRPDMSCLGPEIRNSHEVDEEVWTDSLNPCLGAMLYTIEHIKNYNK